MGVVFAVRVFVGFAPTYYLRTSRSSRTSWLVHRRARFLRLDSPASCGRARRNTDGSTPDVGVAGGALAVLMLVVGYFVAISAARRTAQIPGQLQFLVVPVGALIVFPVLVGAAFQLRRRVDFHKRLMLLATIELMNAAIDHLPGVFAIGLAPFYPVDLFLLALVIYDGVTLRHLHPATLWGGSFLVVMQVLRVCSWIQAHGSLSPSWLTR